MNTEKTQDEKANENNVVTLVSGQKTEENAPKFASSAKELKTFSFNGKALTVLSDDKGELWFIAKEVCNVLGIANNRDAVSRLDDDEKLMRTLYVSGQFKDDEKRGSEIPTPGQFKDDEKLIRKIVVSGQNRNFLTINESGLYSLTLTSNKPEAKVFKKWLTSEVLPSIRKTGSYKSKDKDLIFLKNVGLISRLISGLGHEKDTAKRHANHALLTRLCAECDHPMFLPKDPPRPAIHPDALAFWQAYDAINQHGDVNHVHDQIGIAINIPYFYRKVAESGYRLKPFKLIKHLLKAHPDKPLQLTNHALYSRILKKTVRCAVFEITTR